MRVCGTLKCENAAICEKVAKCEKIQSAFSHLRVPHTYIILDILMYLNAIYIYVMETIYMYIHLQFNK